MTSSQMRLRPVLILAAAAASVTIACGESPPKAAAAPQAAPDVRLVNMNGDSVALEGMRGEVVLLNIWATWCAPCREEMPYLQELHARHEGEGLKVIGVSIDARGEEERIRRFLGEFGVTFPIWLDPDERVSYLLRSVGVPSTYLIDRSGLITWRFLGPLKENDPSLVAALRSALSAAKAAG